MYILGLSLAHLFHATTTHSMAQVCALQSTLYSLVIACIVSRTAMSGVQEVHTISLQTTSKPKYHGRSFSHVSHLQKMLRGKML